tara:strand:- start:2386 stop:3285 length:900 start_codon:yes stop_codon:yes gene_type:complete
MKKITSKGLGVELIIDDTPNKVYQKKQCPLIINPSYPFRHYCLKIVDDKLHISLIRRDPHADHPRYSLSFKITEEDQISFLYDILKNINVRNKYFKKGYIHAMKYFVVLEDFRHIHDGVINDLIKCSAAHQSNKLGAFGYLGNGSKPHRTQFIEMCRKFPDKFEYIETNKFTKKDPSMLSFLDVKKKFKYLIDLVGHCYLTKLYAFLHSKRVIMLCDNHPIYKKSRCEWERKLVPWKHYVPINSDFSDLVEKYDWCEENPNEMNKILKNVDELIKNSLNHQLLIDNFINRIKENLHEKK